MLESAEGSVWETVDSFCNDLNYFALDQRGSISCYGELLSWRRLNDYWWYPGERQEGSVSHEGAKIWDGKKSRYTIRDSTWDKGEDAVSRAIALKCGWVPEQSTGLEEAKGKYEYSNTFCHFKYVLFFLQVWRQREISSVCLPNANGDQKDLVSVVFVGSLTHGAHTHYAYAEAGLWLAGALWS